MVRVREAIELVLSECLYIQCTDLNRPIALLVLSFLSLSLATLAHASPGSPFKVFPQSSSVFTSTQTCSPNSLITASSITITMGTCSPEYGDVNARGQQFQVESVSWNAVFNGTNTALTTSIPPNEIVGFLTDDTINFNKHEVGIICKLDQGLFIGYYQDNTVSPAQFVTTGSLGSCIGSSTLTAHNFSVSINHDGNTNTFLYAVDTYTWTLKYATSTNYSRLMFWWWMTVHRNGSWNVPHGTQAVYNSISVIQDVLPEFTSPNQAAPPAPSNQQTQQSTAVPTLTVGSSPYPLTAVSIFMIALSIALPFLLSKRFRKKHHRRY